MAEWKEKLKKLWKNQKFGKDSFLIMILGGLLLVVIAWPVEKNEAKKESAGQSGIMVSSDDTIGSTGAAESSSLSSYTEAMEARLKQILESMDGVGEVQVMITYSAAYELVPLQEITRSSSGTVETDSSGGTRTITDEAYSQATVYTIDAQGNQVPYVISTQEPEVIGVAVSAQGGGDPVVQKNITDVIQSLFRIEANRIMVTRMKS